MKFLKLKSEFLSRIYIIRAVNLIRGLIKFREFNINDFAEGGTKAGGFIKKVHIKVDDLWIVHDSFRFVFTFKTMEFKVNLMEINLLIFSLKFITYIFKKLTKHIHIA